MRYPNLEVVVTNSSPIFLYRDDRIVVQMDRWEQRVVSFHRVKGGRRLWGFNWESGIFEISHPKFTTWPIMSMDSFLAKLGEVFPEEMDFFLWHPEVAEGKWNDLDSSFKVSQLGG